MIPKIIHYCWFGGKSLTEDAKRYIETWRKYCPDYEIMRWDESNFDVMQNLYCKEAYEAKKWAFVSDYVRLKVLYDYGGIYMDTDVEVIKSLDPLLCFNAMSGYESKIHIPTGTIGACRNNDWIFMLLQDYDGRHFINESGEYDLTTNVQVITDLTTKKYHLKLNGDKIVFGDNIAILPFDYLCAKSPETGEECITENTYTIHHFAGSWLDENMQLYEALKKEYYEKYKILIPDRVAFALARGSATYKTGGWGKVFDKLLKKVKERNGK